MKFLGKRKGFTLIEMLIVIVIIGVLASALIPRLGSARGRAQDVARKADLQQAATAIISYQIDSGSFPTEFRSFTDTGFQADLRAGGMQSIPLGDVTATRTGMRIEVASGYMYYSMQKNGINNNGFLLVSQVETAGGANFVYCGGVSFTKIEDVELCDEVTVAATCGADGPCTGQPEDFRYIYKY